MPEYCLWGFGRHTTESQADTYLLLVLCVINIVFADNNQTLWQYLLFSQKQSCLASTRQCWLETPCWGKTPRFAIKNLELESSYQKASRISQGGGNSNFPSFMSPLVASFPLNTVQSSLSMVALTIAAYKRRKCVAEWCTFFREICNTIRNSSAGGERIIDF